MARLYTNYLNNGKPGHTWASLVANTLGAMGNEHTVREIATEIWGRENPPQALLSQVTTTLNKLSELGFTAYYKAPKLSRSLYNYGLTEAGVDFFMPGKHWEPQDHTDSKLFERSRNVVSIKRGKKRVA